MLSRRKSTIEPAIHLGLGDRIGSLEPGKQADMIFVNLASPSLRPVFDQPVPTLVYNANRSDVDTVMVDGEILVRGGELTRCSMAEILRDAQKVADEIYEDYKAGR